MAGSASFKLVASNCCAAGWLAREDSEVEATKLSGSSWRTFCWLSTFNVETHRLVAETVLPPWLRLLLLHDDRTGMAAPRRTREAPRSRGEADMVLCALVFTCKPESHSVSLPVLHLLRVELGCPEILEGRQCWEKLTWSLQGHCRDSGEGEARNVEIYKGKKRYSYQRD